MKIVTQAKKGFTLVEIMIVVVIIGLLAAMAIPAFQKVRENSQNKTIVNNLRQISSGAQQYFLETGANTVAFATIVGDGADKYVRTITPVAGEVYTGMTITPATTQLAVTKSDNTSVTFDY